MGAVFDQNTFQFCDRRSSNMSISGEPDTNEKDRLKSEPPYKLTIVWKNAFGFIILHLLAVYSLYPLFFVASWKTLLWTCLVFLLTDVGVTVGAHRLYTHRSFTASTGLRIFLVACQTITGQNCLYVWVRDHRQHHKYSDTDADPHNSTRGFFFSHMGWLMVRKHPEVIAKGKSIDMSDLEADPFVMFQKKYYKSLYFLLAFFMPVAVPCLVLGEHLTTSFFVAYMFRYIMSLHVTWSVNSAAHLWGMRPYNKNLAPVENLWVSIFAGGEGWHNFHHQFPWDYRAAEFGMKFNLNCHIINFFANIGLATNLRSASKNTVESVVKKCGDRSHHLWGSDMSSDVGAKATDFNKQGVTLPRPKAAMRSG